MVPPPPPPVSVTIDGTLNAPITGTSFTITTATGQVTVDASSISPLAITRVGVSVVPLSNFEAGNTLQVTGFQQPDGSILATGIVDFTPFVPTV